MGRIRAGRGGGPARRLAGGLGTGLRAGLIAGAAGTLALEAVTYADMLLRGRPPSPVPGRAAAVLAARAGLSLGDDPARAAHRREGLGALLGHLGGVAGGVAYALVEPAFRRRPAPVAATAVGLGAMAAADVSAVRAGLTDPRDWGFAGWLSDIVPHLVYGAVTTAAHRAVRGGGRGTRVVPGAVTDPAGSAESTPPPGR